MASKIYMEKTSRVEAPGCEPGSCCLTQALGCGLAPSPQAEKAAARQDQLRAAGDILVNSCAGTHSFQHRCWDGPWRARVRPGAKLDASRFHPVTLMQGSAAFAVVANTLAARSTLQSRLLSASAISGRAKSSMSR